MTVHGSSNGLRFLEANLSAHTCLDARDQDLIRQQLPRGERVKLTGQDIITEGEHPHSVIMVLEGWACRYKALSDGRRQIVSLFLPGDVGFANISLLDVMDHSIGAITDVRYMHVPSAAFAKLLAESPALSTAIHRMELTALGIAHAWTCNLGQHRAPARLAHLMCELFVRLRQVGLVDRDRFGLPLTQRDLGHATGLTEIHVNRSLQNLRRNGFIELHDGILRIPDLQALSAMCEFDASYLHLRIKPTPNSGDEAGITPERCRKLSEAAAPR